MFSAVTPWRSESITGIVAQICPNAYSGNRAMRQKASIERSRTTAPKPRKVAVIDTASTVAGRVSRRRTMTISRKTPLTTPEAKKLSRYVGSAASSGSAISGPMVMPVFSATRETLNASVRCSIVVMSAIIALLAVMNWAQPNAASKAISATMTARSVVRPGRSRGSCCRGWR